MIEKINHIAIAVENLDEEIKRYRDILGLEFHGTEEVVEQKVRTAFFDVGGVHIELLEPTSPDSPISKFLEKKGQGIHHIAFQVGDIVQTIETMKERGVRMLDEEPRNGANRTRIAFAHPKSLGGVLTEFTEQG